MIVHDECCADVTDIAVINRILEPHRNGVPAVVLHCGMHCYRSEGYPNKTTPWFEFTGLPSTGHSPATADRGDVYRQGQPDHEGLADWKTINEAVQQQQRQAARHCQAARTRQAGQDRSGRGVDQQLSPARPRSLRQPWVTTMKPSPMRLPQPRDARGCCGQWASWKIVISRREWRQPRFLKRRCRSAAARITAKKHKKIAKEISQLDEDLDQTYFLSLEFGHAEVDQQAMFDCRAARR